jgi:predicted molibdopterin-dependent oxidoreductase YjgC
MAFDGRDGDIVVILGRPSLAESPAAVLQAAAALAALPNVKFLSALRRGNVRGALDLGLTPGFLPGRVTLDAGREHYTEAWGAVPAQRGLDTSGMLTAASAGTISAMVLLGADVLEDYPDRIRSRSGLDGVGFLVAVGAFGADAAANADVFLPTTVWGEKSGSSTNLEGRVQRLARLITPEGSTMDDWRIAAELAARLGTDFGLYTVEEVQEEIARVAPAHQGVTPELLRRARDGAVLPIAEHPDELVFEAPTAFASGPSWEPIAPATLEAAEEADITTDDAVDADAGDDAGGDEVAPAAPALPPLHEWDRSAPAPATVPPDAYSLRLVAARTLYDAGRTAASSPSVAALAPGTALTVHPNDLARIGVQSEGDDVRITSSRGTVTLPVRADAATAPGTAFIAFAQGGAVGAADLIDIESVVTELRVETVR